MRPLVNRAVAVVLPISKSSCPFMCVPLGTRTSAVAMEWYKVEVGMTLGAALAHQHSFGTQSQLSHGSEYLSPTLSSSSNSSTPSCSARSEPQM